MVALVVAVGALGVAAPAQPVALAQQEIPADLAVTKTASPNPVQEGQVVTYTITVTNVGEGPAFGVLVSDSFITNGTIAIVSVEPAGACQVGQDGVSVSCQFEVLEPGQEVTITIEVHAQSDGQILNDAEATSESTDSDEFNNSAQQSVIVEAAPKTNLTIDKTGPDEEVLEGEEIIYTVVVRNEGDVEARDVVVTDVLSRFAASVHEATSTSGTCTIGGEGLTPNEVTCRIDVIPAGGTVTITIKARGLGVGVLRNDVRLASSASETSMVDNEDSHFTPVGPATHCPVDVTRGYFAPTQGVWQDDQFFTDKPGKRLVQRTPTSYRAGLPMVRHRSTVLVGVHRAVDGIEPHDRGHMVIRGRTTGTIAAPVTMLMTAAGSTLDHMPDPFDVLEILPPCGPPKSFRLELDASTGRPDPGAGAFQFSITGGYRIENQLVRPDRRRVGDEPIVVTGRVVQTIAPELEFIPARILPGTGPEVGAGLSNAAESLMIDFRQTAPDYLPLVPGSFDATTVKTGFVSLNDFVPSRPLSRRIAFITRVMGMSSLHGNGARQVLVLTDDEMAAIWGSSTLGSAESQKAIFVKESALGSTVAHELVHTLPFLWTGINMARECDHDFHPDPNEANRRSTFRVANGLQLTDVGIENRGVHERSDALMGPAFGSFWITQCTYKHLVDQLQQPQDPPVLIVQGELRKKRGRIRGNLAPIYQMDGVADLQRGRGRWRIVLRNARGGRIGRFPFKPYFRSSEGQRRNAVSFVFQIPDSPRIARVDLVGPDGRLATRRFSAHAPTLTLTPPANDIPPPTPGEEYSISWAGDDADGDRLTYTALYSDDDGDHWELVLFESPQLFADVTVGSGDDHVLRVITSDGARSARAEISF